MLNTFDVRFGFHVVMFRFEKTSMEFLNCGNLLISSLLSWGAKLLISNFVIEFNSNKFNGDLFLLPRSGVNM